MKNLITITVASIVLLTYTSWVIIIDELIKGYGIVLFEWIITGFLTIGYLGLIAGYIGTRRRLKWTVRIP